MLKLIVRKERVGPILGRHPWVFSGALKQIPDGLKNGEPVVLTDETGRFLAQGYFNSYSQIAARIWSWDEKDILLSSPAGGEVKEGREFFEKKIKQACEIRKKLVESKKTDSYRLIHSENDLLPGLIVDKYGDYLVVQFHTEGMERRKDKIVCALTKILKPKGIYERSDVMFRKREHRFVIPSESRPCRDDEGSLSSGDWDRDSSPHKGVRNDSENKEAVGLLYGKIPEKIKITENGYKFWVDVIGGQKTGFFLDQRDKRQALAKYCEAKSVLNCFSYTGGFSVYALGAGAKHVVSVDTSEPAIEMAKENIKLNKLDLKKCEFHTADVKNFLSQTKDNYDVIILDPPAFVKDRRKIQEGLMGYKKINEMALRALKPGGILVTCSCSAHVSLQDFRYMLSESAGRAGRTLQILEIFTHGIDHPELVAFTEGEYLKCIFAKAA